MSLKEKTAELSRLNEELKREIDVRKNAEVQLEQRTELLSTLLDVSNLVSSTLELKPLLEAILDRLKKIIDYKGARILILEGEVLKVVAQRTTLPDREADNYNISIKQMPVYLEIISARKTVVISDVTSDEPMACAFRETMGANLGTELDYVGSWLGIPLIIKDKVVGALTIDHSEPGHYLPQHTGLGMAFANQAAIEYENARLYSETLKRADELKTMFSVQQAITSRLESKSVMSLIADESRRLTNSARTAVFMVKDNDLILSVFSGKDSEKFSGYHLPIDKSLVGQSLISGIPLMVNNAQENHGIFTDLVIKAQVKSFLSIPLKAGSKPVGIIMVVDKLSGEFNSDDERILGMLGSIAVIGLENARLYEDEKRRHMEDEQRWHVAEGLRDILAILNSNRPLKDILDFIIKQATNLMGTTSGSLYRFKKENNALRLEAACGMPEELLNQPTVTGVSGAIERAVLERKPILVTDLSGLFSKSEKDNPQIQWFLKCCSGIVTVPLICKDEVYGGIVLYFKEVRKFTKEDVGLAMTLADQAALAIDNARLRAKVEKTAIAAERSRLARDLHDAVTQTLFSSSLIAEVLPKIWERNQEEGRRRLEELRQLARGALAEMRTLLLELRPATLVDVSLDDLLRQLSEATIGRARVPVALNIEGHKVLPFDVKIAFYRIAQEALNNIAKHSGASKAQVNLKYDYVNPEGKQTVKLIISDNGRGFDPCHITGEHLGIGIMRERTEAIRAELVVDSCIGKGTDIIVCWEVYREEE